jgi:hypothetical protein
MFSQLREPEAGSSLGMQHSWPNNPVELTAHSAGFLEVRRIVVCGPQLTEGVGRRWNEL